MKIYICNKMDCLPWKNTLNISFGYLLGVFNVPCYGWCQDQFWPQWLERDHFTAVFREKFRSQGTWRRVTGTNLDKTLDTQQTHKIRHRINFVSESVWPMRGSAIDLMTNKRRISFYISEEKKTILLRK